MRAAPRNRCGDIAVHCASPAVANPLFEEAALAGVAGAHQGLAEVRAGDRTLAAAQLEISHCRGVERGSAQRRGIDGARELLQTTRRSFGLSDGDRAAQRSDWRRPDREE